MENSTNGIKEKNFLDKKDLQQILNGGGQNVSDYMVKEIYKKIHKVAVDDLTEKGLFIPAKNIIPAVYVWEYLKPYGITR